MSVPSIYSDGTISVVNGSAAFVGVGTAWSTQLKRGTQIHIGTVTGIVGSITDDTNGVFAAVWAGTSQAGVTYVAETWSDGGEIADALQTLIERMIGKGLGAVSASTPDESAYRDNDLVYDRHAAVLYIKDQGLFRALVSPLNFDAFGTATGSPNDRSQYDDGQGDLPAYIGRGLTFFAIPQTGFYILLTPAAPPTPAVWSSLISIAGTPGANGTPGSAAVTGTSLTSQSIGTGSKTFTVVETNRGWAIGARLRFASLANPTVDWMGGIITAYSGVTLTVLMDQANGSGTHSDWSINLAGQPASTSLTYREVTAAGAITVASSDRIIGVNKSVGAPTNVNMGLASARNGEPITIKDIKGDADVNPISLVMSGGEQIDGAPSSPGYTISVPHGSQTLYPRVGGWYTLT